MWTEAKKRGANVDDVAKWMCEATAKLVGLGSHKGSIRPGHDADFCVWDPSAEFAVDAARLQHKNKITPYQNKKIFGVVRATFLRGEKIYDAGSFAPRALGRHLCTSK